MAKRWEVDEFGILRPAEDTRGMTSPYACGACGHIHDTAKVTVVARYADCSMWRCPKCNALQDDREGIRGPGQARRIAKRRK